MNDQQIAATFYQEILKQYDEERLEETVKFEELYSFLNKVFVFITQKEKIQFSTQFARIAFACHKFDVPQDVQWFVHEFRKRAQDVFFRGENYESVFYQLGLKGLSETIKAVYGMAIPANLQSILPKGNFYKKSPIEVKSYQERARVTVLEVLEKEEILVCQDEEISDRLIQVKYNQTGINESFNPTISSIKKNWSGHATLNLLEIAIDEAGVYYPNILVLEPDYLVDVSAIANCFSLSKAEPALYLLKKFLPYDNSIPLSVGNIANFLLDELMSDSDADFTKIFPQVFRQNPIGFTNFDDSQIREIYHQSRKHFSHLREMVKTGFRSNDIEPKHCYLEPTFFSEKYGLQGRLDIWYENQRNAQNSAIVELKSGKPFMTNIYGINESHYMQALLYDLLIKSVFQQSDPRNYILYSKIDIDQLKFAPAIKSKQNEGVRVRNQLVAIEQSLVNLHGQKDKTSTVLDWLSPANFPKWTGFSKKDLAFFHKTFNSISTLERNYLLAFTSFIAREHQLAKTGIQGIDNMNGLASLWLNHYQLKNDNFEIIAHLKVSEKGNKAKEEVPLITFEKDAERTNHLANFRMGDIAILYPSDAPESGETALSNQIFKCTVIEITKKDITVKLRSKQFNDSVFENLEQGWIIEHDTMDHSFNAMYRGLFAFLQFEQRQKNLLLTLSAPQKNPNIDQIDLGNLAEGMTEQQQEILKKAIGAKDYFLLWGPPGTGKTSIMLRNLVAFLMKNTRQNILLLAYTNRAVDEICEAIESIGDFIKEEYIRIGSRYSSNPLFHDNLFDKKIEDVDKRAQLQAIINDHRIFVATVSSMSNKQDLLHLKQFDTVIIDEASQILEPMLVGLLPHFKKFILVGDHKQLPAVVTQDTEHSKVWQTSLNEIGLNNMRDSLFERLFLRCRANNWEHAFDMLSYQGRMHQDIVDFPNEYFYEKKLHILPKYCKIDQSSPSDCALPEIPTRLERHLAQHRFSFISTPTDNLSRTRKTNRHEAEMIAQLVDSYCRIYEASGFPIDHNKTIGIITPYRAQIAQIKQELERYGKGYEHFSVDTVERYQGSAREVVLLSLCLNHIDQLDSLVSLSTDGQADRKLNVALTRARNHLVVIGNEDLLRSNAIYNQLIDFVNARGGVFNNLSLEEFAL